MDNQARGGSARIQPQRPQAQSPVEQFKDLVAAETKAGRVPGESPQVRLTAQNLVREARSNRDVANEINAISDKTVRRPLIEANKRLEELQKEGHSAKGDAVKAATITGQIADPVRRADAEKIVAGLTKIAGVDRIKANDRSGNDRDFEQGQS